MGTWLTAAALVTAALLTACLVVYAATQLLDALAQMQRDRDAHTRQLTTDLTAMVAREVSRAYAPAPPEAVSEPAEPHPDDGPADSGFTEDWTDAIPGLSDEDLGAPPPSYVPPPPPGLRLFDGGFDGGRGGAA